MSAKGSDIKAGAAFVELYVKDEKLKAGLKNAQTALQSFGRTLQVIGGFMAATGVAILGPLAAAVHSFTEFGSSLNDMSERTGVSAQSLAELAHAAQQTGTDIEAVEKALKFMAKNGMDPRTFDEVAARIAAIEDPTLRVQKALEAWGKAGTALLPMVANLKSLRAEARALGIVFTDDQVKLADELGDAYDRIKTALKAAAFQVGAALAPALIKLADLIKTVVVLVGGFAKTFPVLTTVVAALGVALLAAGAALIAFGTIAAVVIPAVTALFTVLDAAALPWILLGAAIAVVVVAFAAVEAVIVGTIAYLLLFTKTGRKLLDTMLIPFFAVLKRFAGLGDVFKKTFGGISDALKAGDMEKLWQIVLLGMRAAWHEFVASIFTGIRDIIRGFKELAKFGVFGIAGGIALSGADSLLNDLIKSNKLDSATTQNELNRIRKSLGAGGKKEPGDPGYGLGERSAAVIGFNARSALMGRQIVGGGRNDVLDTMQKWLLIGDKQLNKLEEIRKRSGAIKVT